MIDPHVVLMNEVNDLRKRPGLSMVEAWRRVLDLPRKATVRAANNNTQARAKAMAEVKLSPEQATVVKGADVYGRSPFLSSTSGPTLPVSSRQSSVGPTKSGRQDLTVPEPERKSLAARRHKVEAVAAALLHCGTLSGSQVRQIVAAQRAGDAS